MNEDTVADILQLNPFFKGQIVFLDPLKNIIEDGVRSIRWTNCDLGEDQIIDGMGGDGGGDRVLVPLHPGGGDHVEGEGKADRHGYHPGRFGQRRPSCGYVCQAVDGRCLQKLSHQVHRRQIPASRSSGHEPLVAQSRLSESALCCLENRGSS